MFGLHIEETLISAEYIDCAYLESLGGIQFEELQEIIKKGTHDHLSVAACMVKIKDCWIAVLLRSRAVRVLGSFATRRRRTLVFTPSWTTKILVRD